MLLTPSTIRDKKVLIAPLDWGMGHAARCIPLIKQLASQSNSITIACTTWQKEFLSKELTGISFVELFGYRVRYSSFLPLWLKLLLQVPRLNHIVKKENRWLKTYLKKNKADVVISDNRFGFFNSETKNTFITHQVWIKAPVFSRILNRINHSFIRKYDACWVPDHADEKSSLSGTLSHNSIPLKNMVYIGPLSRFTLETISAAEKTGVIILLSGAEPQRTILEQKLTDILSRENIKVTLVRGTLSGRTISYPSSFRVIDSATTQQLEELLLSARTIICRSGYSTLMDLSALKRKAVLIPTPGQTEQEYLAAYWKEKFGFETISQDHLSGEKLRLYLAP